MILIRHHNRRHQNQTTTQNAMSARILCVDWSNDGRSVFAQAYLELLRIWLADTRENRSWLFKDISSAGCFVSSDFSRKHSKLFPKGASSLFMTKQERNNLALSAYDKQGTFEGAEKRAVMARVGNRRIRGLRGSDFQKSFILCFDKATFELLKLLRQAASNDANGAPQIAQIHLVEIGSDMHKAEKEMKAAKERLRGWATKYLGWKEPSISAKGGFWRTKQILIPDAGLHALLREKENRLTALKKESDCDYHFSSETEEGMRLVSIVGKKDRLDEAATKILESW